MRKMAENPNVLTLSDENFAAEVDARAGLTVVDFWAAWCAPCRLIAPFVDQLATEYAGRVRIGKVDLDTNPKTGARFGVRSIPTLLFFKDGKLVDQLVGANPKMAMQMKIESHL
jgi:thioredoxin 1